jgi:hypothetical protein
VIKKQKIQCELNLNSYIMTSNLQSSLQVYQVLAASDEEDGKYHQLHHLQILSSYVELHWKCPLVYESVSHAMALSIRVLSHSHMAKGQMNMEDGIVLPKPNIVNGS